jgi:chromate transporter
MAGTVRAAAVWLVVWLLPLGICLWLLGPDHLLTQEGAFFSKAALVTFGGAYAVLPYVAQYAVEVQSWLSAPQMMDGLGLAETTPGPLILVLQFVGFMGGWNHPEAWSPMVTATVAAIFTAWMTFAPGFLFIFVGGPLVEQAHGNLKLTTALSAVTAAVVGVVLNLAVWFGWHVIVPAGDVDWVALAAAALFFIATQFLKWDVIKIVALGAVFGLVVHLIELR